MSGRDGKSALATLIDQILYGVAVSERDGQPAVDLQAIVGDLIDAHPELLAPATDTELALRLEAAQDPATQAQLEAVRYILGLCRKVGNTAPLRTNNGNARDKVLAFLQMAGDLEQKFADGGLLRAALAVVRGQMLLQLTADPEFDSEAVREAALEALGPGLAALWQLKPDPDLAWLRGAIGLFWIERGRGNRAENLEQAVICLESALTVCTRDANSGLWATFRNHLGIAYAERLHGDRTDSLKQAITCYQDSLTVQTRDANPQGWADIQINLGNVHRRLIHGSRAGNVEQAITYYESALSVYTRSTHPRRWAGIRNNLGNAYRERSHGDRTENLKHAIACFEDALAINTRDVNMRQWADARNNLGLAYKDLRHEDRAKYLERAIACFEDALIVRTRDADPYHWAETSNHLGNAYSEYQQGDRAENLEKAIACFEDMLTVRTRDADPRGWAATCTDLGSILNYRVHGDRRENLERAIACFEDALTVCTRNADPHSWADVNSYLGTVYRTRLGGDRAENLERSIAYQKDALTIYTRDANPQSWGDIRNNLGNAYRERSYGDHDDNIEQSIACFIDALSVCTRDADPFRWAITRNNLGASYSMRQRGDRSDNLEQAIVCFEDALTIRTRNADPNSWARTKCNLGGAYRDRWRGNRIENLRHVTTCWADALPIVALNEPGRALTIGILQGTLLLDLKDVGAALATWRTALGQREALLRAGLSFETRSDAAQSTINLASCLALLEISNGEVGAAVATLERSRALSLREALALDDVWLDRVPGPQRARIVAGRDRLAGLYAAPPRVEAGLHPGQVTAWEKELRNVEAELKAAQDAAGFVPLPPLDGPGLSALAPAGGAVVLLTTGPDGGAAVVLPAGRVAPTAEHVVTLRDASAPVLRKMLAEWIRIYLEFLNAPQIRWWSSLLSANAVLAGALDQLWSVVMGPVLTKVAELGVAPGEELVLLPQGDLALLPLHAAWREVDGARRSVLDQHVVSYAPSGASLRAARQRLTRLHADDTKDAQGCGPGLLGLFNSMHGTGRALRWTEAVEMPALRRVFLERGRPAHCLAGEEASVDAVLGSGGEADSPGAAEAGYLHLSCHGSFDGDDPERSGLQLAGGALLSVRDIVRHLRLRRARWVALSACETGMVDVLHLPDEFVGLPAALLQAGAPGVVATLWSVLDGPTALLMPKLYEQHLGGQGWARGDDPVRLEPAAALRRAVLWLQDMSWEEMQAALAAAATGSHADPTVLRATRDAGREDMVQFGPDGGADGGTAPLPTASPYTDPTVTVSPHTRVRDLPVIWAAYTFHGV